MDKELMKKIFTYNIYWLEDEKKFGDKLIEKLETLPDKIAEKYLGGKQYRNFLRGKDRPSYIKGSLIDNSYSLELKENLRSKFLGSPYIMDQFIKTSQYCVVNEFSRYKECNSYELSRPLITFITTKENADKLKYLDNQKLKLEYLSIDYKNIKYSLRSDTRETKPNPYKYRTLSTRFNNFLLKSKEDINSEYFFYIPTNLKDKQGDVLNSNQQESLQKTSAEILKAKKELEDYELELRLDPKDQIKTKAVSDTKKQIELLEKQYEEYSKNSQGLYVKDKFILEPDYEYKRLLERFQFRVENKLKVKLDLDEWSFCIVFSPFWCDSKNIPTSEKGGLDLLRSIVSNNIDISKSFNRLDTKESVDFTVLDLLEFAFKEEKVSQIDSFQKIGELKDYSLVLKGFQEYPNGGYWVKKIVKEKGIFKEKTEGPYSMKEGENRVKILKNIMVLENVEVAKLYEFKDLVCIDDLLELEENNQIDKYVKTKNRFRPPPGAKLFCLIKGFMDVVFFDKLKLSESFRKFSNHAINTGMNYLSTFDYLIYYNPDSKTSIRRAGELKTLLRKKEDYIDEEFLWLADAIQGRKIKRGKEPPVKPFKILSEYQERGRIEYQGLVDLYNMIEVYECSEDRLGISFDNFKNALGSDYATAYRDPDFNIKMEINLGVIQNKKDDKVKKFKIIRNYDGTLEIGMHRFRKRLKDIDLISVKEIKDCRGYLDLKFKNLKDKSWEVSKLNLISNDDFFNNEIVLICLTLFVSKSFGLRTVILDNRLKPSECSNNVLFHYYHIYYIAMGNFQSFQEIGFMIENYGEYKQIIESIKSSKIIDFAVDKKLRIKVPKNVRDLTLENFCKDYIMGDECFTKSNLIILNQISAYINSLVNLDIFIDLDDISFEHLLKYISYDIY